MSFSFFSNLIKNLLDLFQVLSFVIFSLALVFFLWNMMVFVLNSGNDEKRTIGKQRMIWGIVIFVVMFGIWGIVKIIMTTFGITGGGEGFLFPITPR